jgi:hypothetical protein
MPEKRGRIKNKILEVCKEYPETNSLGICPVGKAPVVLLGVTNTVVLDGAPSKSVRQSATHAHVALGARPKVSARIEAGKGLSIILMAFTNQPT